MAGKTPKPKHQTPTPCPEPVLRIGQFVLMRTLWPCGIWITNASGEGMMTGEAKLERMLKRYWKREF